MKQQMTPIDLVTGASGLLGSNLVHALIAQGRRVRILVRSQSRTAHLDHLPGLEKAPGDITAPESLITAMSGVENVYHCAARVAMNRQMTGPIWQANVVGTQNVLRAARQAAVRRVIHCSSVDAIGLPEPGQAANEETPWNWERLGVANAYARSKHVAQQQVLEAAHRGLDAVVVCPAYMFGPYDIQPSSGRMILALSRSVAVPALSGGNSFVDVQDVVDGMIDAAGRGRRGEVYILGGTNLPYDRVFEMIGAALEKKILRVPVPPPLAWLAGKTGDLLEEMTHSEPPVNSALARLGMIHHYYDSSKAIRELQLPRRPLEKAIDKAVAWFRQAGMLPGSCAAQLITQAG